METDWKLPATPAATNSSVIAVAALPTIFKPEISTFQTPLTGRIDCFVQRIAPAPVRPSRRTKTAAAACAVAPVASVAKIPVQTCRTPAPPAARLVVACVAAAGVEPWDQLPGETERAAPSEENAAMTAAAPERMRSHAAPFHSALSAPINVVTGLASPSACAAAGAMLFGDSDTGSVGSAALGDVLPGSMWTPEKEKSRAAGFTDLESGPITRQLPRCELRLSAAVSR